MTGKFLNQSHKFFHCNACTTDQSAERSSVELSMIGHRQMTAVWMIQDDVAPLLVVEDKPEFPERFDRVAAGDNRQRSHQAATLISTISGEGMGRFCARRTSIIPSIASRMFLSASSLVFP